MQIRLSKRSIEDYNEIIKYLQQNFSDKEVLEFNLILKTAKAKILRHPESGNLYQDKIRYVKLISTVYMYYRISEKYIDIATLYNAKQNPIGLSAILKD